MIDESLNLPNKVEDIYGNVIYLDGEPLGQGGQGIVCRTKDKNIALKFLVKNGSIIQDEQIYESYKNRINDISILKIDDDINICRPEIILKKPTCGYVMKLLNELTPVSNLIYSTSYGEYKDYLISDGTLKKKLEVLIDLSRVLARLHSKGMIYGDLSPNNVFYSKKDVFSKVWLIDCDNLHLYDETVSTIFTPGYGAPEVVKKVSPNTQYSDSFSFSVLAFKILTSQHPFINDYNGESSSGGWDASTVSTESDADANDVLWLCDSKTNAPEDLKDFIRHFVPANLMKLFDATFNDTGRKLPYTRPSMRTWFENLCQVYTKIWKCSCGNFNFFTDKKCFSCNNSFNPESYCSLFSVCGSSIHDEVVNKFKESLDEDDRELFKDDKGIFKDKDIVIYNGMTLYNFDFENICIYETPHPYISFSFFNDSLVVSNTGKVECEYITSSGEKGRLSDDKKLNKGEKMYLFFYKNKVKYKQLLICA